MTTTPVKLCDPALLTTGVVTYYTAPAATKTIIKKLTFTNTDGSNPYTVTVFLIPVGGYASIDNCITPAQSVGAHEVYECFEAEGQVLNPGDFIQAASNIDNLITIFGAGVEIS